MNRIGGSMKTLIVAAALTLSGLASATPKPVVCLSFTEATLPVNGATERVVICTDGKKPSVLLRPSFVTIADADGQPLRIAIGWRQ